MKHFYFLLLILFVANINLFAKDKDPGIEDLKRQTLPALKHEPELADTLTVNRLNQLAQLYFESHPDSTAYYAKLALARAKKISFLKGAADAHIQIATVNTFKNNFSAADTNLADAIKLYTKAGDELGISEAYMGLGRLQDYRGRYDSALYYFNRALSVRKALYEDVYEAESYAIMGITYDNKGEYSKALDCYFRSLKTNLKYNNQLDAADNYTNIGVVMHRLKLYSKALEYYKRSLKIWLHLNNKQGTSTAYQNIGEILTEQKDYKNALKYLRQAAAMFHELGDMEGIDLIYYSLGEYYYKTNQPDSSRHYFELSAKAAAKSGIVYNKANAYCGLAMVCNKQQQYRQAYNYALQGQKLANNLGSRNLRADIVLQLSNALAGLKQFEQAFIQHRRYVTLTDSLQNNESIQKLISYNLAIDFERSQQTATLKQRQKETALKQRITRQRQTILINSAVIVVITILLIFYYNAKRKQTKANALLAEQAEKLNQLNLLKNRLIGILAHDLRAPISTLRNMFVLLSDKDISQEEFIEMLPRVNEKLENTSAFLDTLLVWINSQVDTAGARAKNFLLYEIVENEIAYLNDQLSHKRLDIKNKISQQYAVFADPNCIRIVIHNLLTNAIKFSEIGGIIEVSAQADNDNSITLSVKDYGVGMSQEKLTNLFKSTVTSNPGTLNEIGTGMGLVFCKDLIEKYDGKIWAKNNGTKGTTFSFKLPAG